MVFLIILSMTLCRGLSGQTLEQTTSKGLRMSLIKDTSLLFIHAEIVIYYSEINDPAVPYLTLINLFDDQVNDPQSGLLHSLFKMGNDYTIEYKIDHLIIKVNFLESDINLFIGFLKNLFSYRGFSLREFNYSTQNFWRLFKRQGDWQQIIAAQVAFTKLFSQDHPGQFLVPGRDLGRLNLSHIRSFYKKNYTLPNSYLTIQGDINPYVVFGLIEKEFRNFKNLKANYGNYRYDNYKTDRQVVIVDDPGNGYPSVYWVDPIPTADKITHHHSRIVNNILFGYPFGRISESASGAGIKNFNISWVIHHHRNISILCRRIRLGYRDIEKFIFIADNIIRSLGLGRVMRKEYLDSFNYVFHKEKIEADEYDLKAREKVTESFVSGPDSNRSGGQRDLLKDLSYVNFSKILSDPAGSYYINRNKKKGIIIIFGQASLIQKYLRDLKADVITIR